MTSTSSLIRRIFRKGRVRSRISGTISRPRISVFRSLRSFSAQAIDDRESRTLFAVGAGDLSIKKQSNTVKGAYELGKILAEKMLAGDVTEAVFDRNGYQYHGRVRAFAEGMREGGIRM